MEPPAKANQLLSKSYSPRQTHCTGAGLKITMSRKKKEKETNQTSSSPLPLASFRYKMIKLETQLVLENEKGFIKGRQEVKQSQGQRLSLSLLLPVSGTEGP